MTKVFVLISDNKKVLVGVGVWIFNPAGQILFGKRLSKHGNNMWAPPGGHMEFGETPVMTAIREVREETGLDISQHKISEFAYTNDIFPDKHYVTIHCRVDNFVGVPQIMEPDKCACWHWFDIQNLPEPLFLSARNLLKQNCFQR